MFVPGPNDAVPEAVEEIVRLMKLNLQLQGMAYDNHESIKSLQECMAALREELLLKTIACDELQSELSYSQGTVAEQKLLIQELTNTISELRNKNER